MPPICKQANCPYSAGYLNGYNSIKAPSQQSPPTPKLFEWKVVHDPRWDLYQIWVGDGREANRLRHRCLREKAISYEEGERIAQKYIAAEELRLSHRELVMAAFAS